MATTVSVIIPTYKSAAWISQTLQSVLVQGYPHHLIDVLIIDDHSPDDTVAIARSFLEGTSIKHQIVVREKNTGVAINRNTAWKMVQGDWVQFLDHDDLLAPHKLALQLQHAEVVPADVAVIYSSWQRLAIEGGNWHPTGALNDPAIDDDPVARILEDFNFGYVGPTLVRRSFLPRVGGFLEDTNVAEDIDLMLRIGMAGGRFHRAPSDGPSFFYRQTPTSLWQSYIHNVDAMRNYLQTFRRAEEFLRKRSGDGSMPEYARQALAKRYGRWLPLYREQDPESFKLAMGWLEALGESCPPEAGAKMRMLAKIIGYENALKIRSAVRRSLVRS
jgi:glycosyltransferase involved in cell wall biosynthesis